MSEHPRESNVHSSNIPSSNTSGHPTPENTNPKPPTAPTVPTAPTGRPKMMVDLDPSGQLSQKEPDRQNRQFLNYAFYKLDPAFRRLEPIVRREMREEFEAALESWLTAPAEAGRMLRTYSTIGTRADADFMLWRISFSLEDFHASQVALNQTRLMGYLTQPYNYISMQKRSPYVNRIEGSGHGLELLPGQGKYLFVYPFIKTRAWYDLSPHARQGMMDEHIHASVPFKGIRLNTSYSYGIDDQEFIVAFDSDFPQEFVDLVGRLRYTEASLYTLRDVPMFTCFKRSIPELLTALG